MDQIAAQNVLNERSREFHIEIEQKSMLTKQLERLEEEMRQIGSHKQQVVMGNEQQGDAAVSHEYKVCSCVLATAECVCSCC